MGLIQHRMSYLVYKVVYYFTWLKNIVFRTHPRFLKRIAASQEPLNTQDFNHLQALLYYNKSGYACERDRSDPSLCKENIYLTYGEILPQGLARLFDFIKLNTDDSFVDLGSGAGKTVLQSVLCHKIKYGYGVEIDKARFDLSQEVLAKAKNIFIDLNNIKFIHINIADFNFENCTVIFINSICYGENLMLEIVNRVNLHPEIRAIMTTKRIQGLKHLPKLEVIPVETSWHTPPNKSNCYVYYR